MNEDFNSINNDVNSEVNNGINTTPIDHPINQPIERPVEQAPVVNNSPKKSNGGSKVVIVILIILLLGAIGYILYSNGVFGGKEDNTKETDKKSADKKDSSNVSDDETSEKQYIKVDFSKYKENTIEDLGTFKMNGVEYRISIRRWNCKTVSGEAPDACYDHDYLTGVYVGNAQYPAANLSILLDGGLKELAVLDDRYFFINTGDYGDRQNSSASMIIYDSKNEFKEVEAINGEIFQVRGGYSELENNYPSKYVDRNVGYVDSNTFTYGDYEEISHDGGCKQRYIEYTVTVKEGKFTTEKTFTKDNVFVSAQCS